MRETTHYPLMKRVQDDLSTGYDWSGCPLHDPTMNQPELTTEFSSRDVTGGQDG